MLEIDIEKLKVAQARACLSLEELANKAGISRSSVSKIMRGERRANPKTIGLLAKAMELDVIELIKR
ncbi:MAG: helix-turn-helix transcriptional regulator [Inconstantimicrobium porci]|uniref:helix-turn-helix domain-containing protein n=1 Tax=Inconstantimicrobium porci TaxID=2652291 RepID=UPI002A91D341|nr:helix-turn-helix transcriptional regulator [Inconstantimicrobium porci]MDY5912426.1 helix-turn-helix transcriptional regulator [Inconstantimicrobium porci]